MSLVVTMESDVLEVLPIDNILNDIVKSFSHWNRIDQSYFFENINAPGAFNVETTSKFVRVCCSNNVEGEDMNTFIDILLKYDCPLYDPQVSKRFDGK